MKKIYLSLCGLFIVVAASAQLSVGLNANYTMYKGDFQKSTPGAAIRIGYGFTEKSTGVFSFTYGLPIVQKSTVTMYDGSGNSQNLDSEIKYNFKTFSFNGNYTLVGDDESTGNLYGIVGGSFVLVSYKEDITSNYDKNVWQPSNQMEKDSESGFALNFGAGGSFRIGNPILFGEAAIALPANQVGNTYVTNVIPAHFVFNVGVRIPIGGESY